MDSLTTTDLGVLGHRLLDPIDLDQAKFFLTRIFQHQRTLNVTVLSEVPIPQQPSFAPLWTLSALLDSIPAPWPVFDLQLAYVKFWRTLPEDAKAGKASIHGKVLLDRVLCQCMASYKSIIDLIPANSDEIALIDPESGSSISHSRLVKAVKRFSLPLQVIPGQRRPVVAVSLPNGPLLAATVLAVTTYYTTAPIAHGAGVGAEQFKADVLQSKTNMVLASPPDVERLGLRDAWLEAANIPVLLVSLSADMELVITDLDGRPVTGNLSTQPNTAGDIGVMLFTSGTSGTKKLVPLHIHSLICGVAMVIESWGLDPTMRCLNQMPLNHVGGLVRNLFAPLMSGGSLIACSAFDAGLFWDCVEDWAPTWYYASPTMHQGYLQVGQDRPESVAKSTIRLVCNAAGGLLPSLAIQIRDTLSNSKQRCTVLPSYGMTECMPISTPPLSYQLDKTGTSGISVGPEICVIDGNDRPLPVGETGRVTVRGPPAFSGYLKANDVIDQSCFLEDGRFDTGDMGYMDGDGYLYITGRSKEVINRGGELISPFEVEEAVVTAASSVGSLTEGRISKALCFSQPHDTLQEVVGIAVVTPPGNKRPCLRSLQESVKKALAKPKIPQVIVYMDALPVNNNKVLRIKFAERLGLAELRDDTPQSHRHFEATAPPPNTPLSASIESRPIQISYDALEAACKQYVSRELDVHVKPDASGFYPEMMLAPKSKNQPIPDVSPQKFIEKLAEHLHGYHIPFRLRQLEGPFPRTLAGKVDDNAVEQLLNPRKPKLDKGSMSATASTVGSIFSQILALPVEEINSTSDFFELGGDSMKAGRLLSLLRKEFQLRLPIDVLFTNPSVGALSTLIEERLEKLPKPSKENTQTFTQEITFLPGCEKTCSSTNPLVLALHLVPISIVYPMKRALTWTIFLYCLTYTQRLSTNHTIPGRLLNLVVSMAIGKVTTRVVSPLLAIVFKWLVIGKYRQGLYPMWSSYHNKWWITNQVISIAGMGVFGLTEPTRKLYFRLMGANIGQNVSLSKGVKLGEFDLITIGDHAVLERCTVRPFAAERNTSMYLGRIQIGAGASVGMSSIVAAGTVVPPMACIGANSSSWELSAAHEDNRDLTSNKIPNAHWSLAYLVGGPIGLLTIFAGAGPWLMGLIPLVARKPHKSADMLQSVIQWFAAPERVSWHYFALAVHFAIGPVFFFLAVWLFKTILDCMARGALKPSAAMMRSRLDTFRSQMIRFLLPASRLHKVTALFGAHYEMTSILYRMMGSKIGKRVYWPGTGPSVQDYDMLEVGDDVVFGSRSHVVNSDGLGSAAVRIGSGSMIADRVTLLPGVSIGDRTVMGSGALTKRDRAYPSNTTWVGSKNNDALCLTQPGQVGPTPRRPFLPLEQPSWSSSAPTLNGTSGFNSEVSSVYEKTCKADSDEKSINVDTREIPASPTFDAAQPNESSSPFGRAFYEGKAPYRVWGQFTIFCYSTSIIVVTAVYWNVASISTVQILSKCINDQRAFLSFQTSRPVILYFSVSAFITLLMAAQTILALAVIIGAKWLLLGRRVPGNYDWDKSPYCQRWQLFLKIEELRRHCYGKNGILGLLTGTWWIAQYFRALGADIGKDCALFVSGRPSLYFTEPDLLTMGDRVTVDDASLVGHINTRGKFDLNALYVGSQSVLRSGSRLLSGARMEESSCLLEHTLVMAGDVVDAGTTSQGWPAEEFKESRVPTLELVPVWQVAV